jgi:hypothetical protein
MCDYFKTIDELSIETRLRFIETQDIRNLAAKEMLSSRDFEKGNEIDLKFLKVGLGDSKEFKGV